MTDRCCTPLDSIQVCCTGREVQPSSAATLRRPNTKSIVHTHSQPTAHKQPSHRTYTQSFPRCGTLLPTPHQAAHRTSSLSPFTHTTQHSRQAQPQKTQTPAAQEQLPHQSRMRHNATWLTLQRLMPQHALHQPILTVQWPALIPTTHRTQTQCLPCPGTKPTPTPHKAARCTAQPLYFRPHTTA